MNQSTAWSEATPLHYATRAEFSRFLTSPEVITIPPDIFAAADCVYMLMKTPLQQNISIADTIRDRELIALAILAERAARRD